MITNIVQSMVDWVGSLGNAIDLLLLSPFQRVSNTVTDSQVLSMLNWLMPITEVVALLQAWGAAIAVWYTMKRALRWSKLIS
jgi:hypothetical protein